MMSAAFYTDTSVDLISRESLVWKHPVLHRSELLERAEQLEPWSEEESEMLLILLDFLTTERRIPVGGSLDSLWQASSIAELFRQHGVKITAWSARDCQILLRKLSKKVDAARDLHQVTIAYAIKGEDAPEVIRNAYHKLVNALQSVSRQPDSWLIMLQ